MDVTTVAHRPALLPLSVRAALPRRGGSGVPPTALRLPAVHPDVAHVARYARLCGFTLGAALPLTYPHLLGFPLQMALMADRRFPFPATGLVHVSSVVTQHEAIPVGSAVDVTVHAAGPGEHPRGRTVDLVTEVAQAGGGAPVWTSTSRYLHRERSSAPTGAASSTSQTASRGGTSSASGEADALPTVAVWRLPADLGRRYAAVSGDRNPIHLSAVTAKAFGFPRAIAHGMWTAAACVAAFQGRLPDAVHLDVQFKSAVLLPSTVELGARLDDRCADVRLRSRPGRLHVDAQLRWE